MDFGKRRSALAGLAGVANADPQQLLANLSDGRAKLLLTTRVLRCRRANPGLFSEGAYEPVTATGVHADRVVAFLRRHNGRTALVVAPRLTAALGDGPPIGVVWGDTTLQVSNGLPPRWKDVLTGRDVNSLRLADLFHDWPVALLISDG